MTTSTPTTLEKPGLREVETLAQGPQLLSGGGETQARHSGACVIFTLPPLSLLDEGGSLGQSLVWAVASPGESRGGCYRVGFEGC